MLWFDEVTAENFLVVKITINCTAKAGTIPSGNQ